MWPEFESIQSFTPLTIVKIGIFGQIRPYFELIQDFLHVLVICKIIETLFKTERTILFISTSEPFECFLSQVM